MTREVKLRQAGGSISATLPKDRAERQHLAAGDLSVKLAMAIFLLPPYRILVTRLTKPGALLYAVLLAGAMVMVALVAPAGMTRAPLRTTGVAEVTCRMD